MLTPAAVKAARPRAVAFKLSDYGGLYLYVVPGGRKTYRMRFRWQGREQLLTFGDAREISLEDARARRDAAREQLDRGVDPRVADVVGDAERTFEQVARVWHTYMLPRWTAVHAVDVLASLERGIFPAIGAMPLAAITPPVVLRTLRVMEADGRLQTARRVRQRLEAIFSYAISEGWTNTDPSEKVGRALLPPAPARHHPALLEIEALRGLLAKVDQLPGGDTVKRASRLLALTGVRLAVVRGAIWDEIEDLDGAEPLWRVPAARMKMAKAKKADPRHDHWVPLSPAAVTVLRAQRADLQARDAYGQRALIFPGRGAGQMIGEVAIGDLYDRAGYAGRHVPHGWRASFSTVLNELYPEKRGEIDRALGHVAGGGAKGAEAEVNIKVEAAYNRARAQLGPRRALLEAWAQVLMG